MAITDEIPKSRLTLTYRTTVKGTPEETALPFRALIMGDLTQGTAANRAADLDQRSIRQLDGKNLNQLMADMKMALKLEVPNRIDPETSETTSVELPIEGMKSFTPAKVAQNVPKIRSLLLLRKLLQEVQSNLDNRKEFRALVRQLAQSPQDVQALLAELKGFEGFKVPTGTKANGEAPTA